MKKIIGFLGAVVLLFLTVFALYISGLIFNTLDKQNINTFVFQPNNISIDRVGKPIPVEEMSDRFVREKLIKKLVNDYFYVTPDYDNFTKRISGKGFIAAAGGNVFKEWRNTEAIIIKEMTEKKYLRLVKVTDIVPGGDYWNIYYELKTWHNPNLLEDEPVIETGILDIEINFKNGIRQNIGNNERFDARKHLENGGDPTIIFMFMIKRLSKRY